MFRVLVMASILAGSCCSFGQAVAPAAEDLRKNLEEATRASALETAGTPAFRLEASFDTFDYLGNADGSGTLVEEWLKPGVSRRVITYRGLTWTQVAQGGTVRQSGTSFQGSFMERRAIDALLHAGPAERWLMDAKLTYKPLTIGAVELDCVVLERLSVEKPTTRLSDGPSSYCMSKKPRLVRLLHEQYDLSLTWNHFARLDDHTLGRDVTIEQHGKPRANVHVISFKTDPAMKESDFILPSGPDTSAEDVRVPSASLGPKLLKQVPARYPDQAKDSRVEGEVTLDAIIDPTGKVERLEVIASPAESLTRASLFAVKQWVFAPHMVNGVATAVELPIAINFAFRR